MHIVFCHVRQFEVHNMRQLVNIEATGRNVGCDQHSNLACLEVSQGFRTSALPFAAVNRVSINAIAIQLLGQPVCAVLGACKYEYLTPVAFANLF